MADKKTLTEEQMQSVDGGQGCIRWWKCTHCDTMYTKKFPETKDVDGVQYAYCTYCKQWFPRSEWKIHST